MPLTQAALLKTTLLDYPEEIASVIFTPGCNLRCPYCHNPSLVLDSKNNSELLPLDEIKKFLHKRKNLIGAVVISGGEPLIHNNIGEIVDYIKSMNLKVKIDTNGLFPEKLEKLNVDYIAMDVKTAPQNYSRLGLQKYSSKLVESISYIINSGIDHEFRTTVTEEIVTIDDVRELIPFLKNAEHWYFTAFKPGNTLDSLYSSKEPPEKEYLEKLLSAAQKAGIKSSIR